MRHQRLNNKINGFPENLIKTTLKSKNDMNIPEKVLKTLIVFQAKYPQSHVGGSVGLALHGIDMKRPLNDKTDLDITNPTRIPELLTEKNIQESSSPSDFDYSLIFHHDENNYCYTKIEVRVSPEPSFEVIEYKGNFINVSKLEDILFWKQTYADKGVVKHQHDLEAIKSGVRPLQPIFEIGDDLPF